MKLLSKGFVFLLLVSLLFVGCSNSNPNNNENTPPAPTNDTTTSKQSPVDHKQVINQIKLLADQGKVVGADPFSIGALKTDIDNAWGKHDEERDGGLFYSKQQVAVYYDETNTKLDQLTSYSTSLAGITYQEVLSIAGKPVGEKSDEGMGHIFYDAGSGKYDLTFSFTGVTVSGTDKATLQSVTVGNKPPVDPDQVK